MGPYQPRYTIEPRSFLILDNIMNHLLVMTGWLLACMLVLSSCTKDGNPPTAPGPTSDEYMPLAVGNEWVYTYNGTDSVKYKVVGDTTAYGHTYALLSVSGAFTRNAFLRHDDVYIEGQAFMNMIGDTVTAFVDLSQASGKAWGMWVPTKSGRVLQMWTMKDRDVSVTVPAGTFNDIMIVQCTTGYFLGPQFISISSTEFYWSRSTGLVKHVEYSSASGGSVKTVTAELRSYTLR